MKLLVIQEQHFTKLPNGQVWVDKQSDTKFWERYLSAFDEIVVCARMKCADSLGVKAFQICHVGRFVDVKNHKFILEVARELKNDNVNFQVHLLGDGELFDEIHQMANEMNLEEVCFHGSVENVNEYLKASDLFILPSKYEGLPVTLVEAQSAGVKCLVSNGVPTEADFNLGLMEALPLEKDIWVTRIKQCVSNKKRIAQSDIESAIRNRGYDIRDSANKMLEVYL